MDKSKSSKCVFVGNISFDVTEEEVVDVCSQVGPVVSFRLVFDRETGKPKGFGFCEYADADTAASAIRNLTNFELKGRRLRVDFAESDSVIRFDDSGAPPSNAGGANSGPGMPSGNLRRMEPPPVPMDTGRQANMYQTSGPVYGSSDIAPGNAAEVINAKLANQNNAQIFDYLQQMKQFVLSKPDEARKTLAANPQLAYALLQAQLQLGIVDPAVAQQMIQANPAAPLVAPVTSSGGPPLLPAPAAPMIGAGPVAAVPAYIPATAPMATGYMMPPQAPTSLPAGMHPVVAPMALPAIAASAPAVSPEQQQLLMQVMSLTPQQIELLAPAQRETVLALRSQLGVTK